MVSPVPKPPEMLYKAASPEGIEDFPEDALRCVDCAVESSPEPSRAMYLVSGTALCKRHAVDVRVGTLNE